MRILLLGQNYNDRFQIQSPPRLVRIDFTSGLIVSSPASVGWLGILALDMLLTLGSPSKRKLNIISSEHGVGL